MSTASPQHDQEPLPPASRRWIAAALCAVLAVVAPGPLSAQAAAQIIGSSGLGATSNGAVGAKAVNGRVVNTNVPQVTFAGVISPAPLTVAAAPVVLPAPSARFALVGGASKFTSLLTSGRLAAGPLTSALVEKAFKTLGAVEPDKPDKPVSAKLVAPMFDGPLVLTPKLIEVPRNGWWGVPHYGSDPIIPHLSAGPDLLRTDKVPSSGGKAPVPFVPANKKIGDLERLAATSPESGWTAAQAILKDDGEKRPEVRIAAMRVLETMPAKRFVPLGLELLASFDTQEELILKELGHGHNWYLQRMVLAALGGMAAEMTSKRGEVIVALQAAYADFSAPVRLTAQWALTRYGVAPGPEVDHLTNSHDIDQLLDQTRPGRKPGPRKSKWMLRLGFSLVLVTVLGVFIVLPLFYRAPQQAAVHIQQVSSQSLDSARVEAPPAISVPIATAKPLHEEEFAALKEIAENTRVMAEALKKTPDIAVREAPVRHKGGGLSGLISFIVLMGGTTLLLSWLIKRKGAGGTGKGGHMKPDAFAQAGENVEKSDIRFSDVAGIDEARIEVEEILDFLRNPRRYKMMGAKVPKGVLLEGPPGTGKTLMARALAGESDANFIRISGSDFIEIYVGLGAKRVRELFNQARANAPCVIFIDEIDAVGEARDNSSSLGGGNDERKQTINALLQSMDGFDNTDGVIVLAATNRAKSLDPALTRPGRFDRTVHVGWPDVRGREAILAVHGSQVRLGHDVDLRHIARRTTGLGGAHLANIINEAALLAVRRGADYIDKLDVDEAVDRAAIGAKRTLFLSDEIKLRIARHETGHVLGNLLGAKPSPINKVTIIPHGTGALGFAETASDDEKYIETKSEIEARLVGIMGGMVMEETYYGESSTGPGSDIEKAEHIARVMVEQLGMGRRSGLGARGPDLSTPLAARRVSEATARKIDRDVKEIKEAAKAKAVALLTGNEALVDKMVERLLEKETLTRDEIEEIIGR